MPGKGYRGRRHSASTLATDLDDVGIVGKANWNGILIEPLTQEWEIGCTREFQIRHVIRLEGRILEGRAHLEKSGIVVEPHRSEGGTRHNEEHS